MASDRIYKAVLFKSKERFSSFEKELSTRNVVTTILDFEKPDWISFDYSNIDFIIYYPSFKYSSNHPHALQDVKDNLAFLSSEHPDLVIYPDPVLIEYYNDKYRQFLFLKSHNFPIPHTIPLVSEESVDLADRALNYPMVVKNRYGAGGGAVFKVNNKSELKYYYNLSTLNLFNFSAIKYFSKLLSRRIFYYNLIKVKRMSYPFLSPPLIAQKFIQIDKDLKTVVGDNKLVEGHWRKQANQDMWKMNIDDGGIGEWSLIPDKAIDLSLSLAQSLNANWLNIDFIESSNVFYISEFSPVWHHYAYMEKDSFVYKDDYNIDIPLEVSLNLEHIIVDSCINRCQ